MQTRKDDMTLVPMQAYHKGTVSSKKKKQNKLQRAVRSMQKQQRAEARESAQGSHALLEHVVDPQVPFL
jgi:protein SDA1